MNGQLWRKPAGLLRLWAGATDHWSTAIFSRRIDYGLRALIYLAERRGQGAVTLNQLCDDLRVPRAFMSKILQQLCRSQILRSQKGPSGGFLLQKSPEELTVLEIVEEIEGPVRVFECFSDGTDCTLAPGGNCRILAVFDSVGAGMQEILQKVTLASFFEPEASVGSGCKVVLDRQPEQQRA